MQTVRVVTLNLWGEQPPLDRRLALVIEGLRALAPDVVALQEVRQVPGVCPNTSVTIASALGLHCHFAVSTPWGGGEEGLALLSRFPFLDRSARELPHATDDDRRIVLGARLDTPAGALACFTTHLTYRLQDGQKREDQIVAAEALVAETPSELPKLFMGDFNSVPDSDEIRWLRGLRTVSGRRVVYQDAWEAIHGNDPGYTWSKQNTHAHKLAWLTLDRRIDYVFVGARRRDGRGIIRDCRIVLDRPDDDGCFPTDHFGLFAEVQLVPDKGET